MLKKKEVGETDRLYTLYTLEQGKVRLVAKGVRKSEAKLAGHLETLMQGMVIVVKGRGAGKIAGAVAEKNFSHIRTNGDILQRVLETVTLFEHMVEWDEADGELYQLLSGYLALVDDMAKSDDQEKTFLLTTGFLFKLFAQLGYEIETGICVISGERLKSGEQHFFSPSAGGVLAGVHSHTTREAFPISENVIKLIRIFLNNRLESVSRVTVDIRIVREAEQVAKRFFQWIER